MAKLSSIVGRVEDAVSAFFRSIFRPGPGEARVVYRLADQNYDYEKMEHAYKVNPWIHSAVDVRAQKLASLPIRLYQEKKVGQDIRRDEITDHPLVELLYRPNPDQSQFEFIRDAASELSLAGETFIFADNGTKGKSLIGNIKALHLLHPRFVKAIDVPTLGSVEGYLYDQGGAPQWLPPQLVTHAKTYNPESDVRGLPPMEVGRNPYLLKHYMDQWNISFFKNGGVPKMALVAKGQVDKDVKKRNAEEFQRNFLGAANNGKVPYFDSDTMLQMLMVSARDGEFINFDTMKREEVLAIFKTPPVMVGVMDGATYANAKEQSRAFYELAELPMARLLESAMNRNIVDLWYPGKGLYLQFDFSEVEALQADRLRIAQIDHVYLQDGKVTINELRERDDEPPVPWGGKPYNPIADAFSGGMSSGTPTDVPPSPSKARVAKMRRSEEGRAALWSELIAPVTDFERKFEIVTNAFFGGQVDRIEQRIKESYGVTLSAGRGYQERATIGPNDLGVIFPQSTEDGLIREATAVLYKDIVKRAGIAAATSVDSAVEFNVNDPRVQELIGSKVQMIARVNNTTRDQILNILTSSAIENATVEDTARAIRSWFGDMSPARARTIARTEVIGANNAATLEGFKQSGVVEKKEWLSSRDADVRESHIAMDGIAVPLPQLFPNGVDYPGGNGPADETINCRCTVLAVLEEAA